MGDEERDKTRVLMRLDILGRQVFGSQTVRNRFRSIEAQAAEESNVVFGCRYSEFLSLREKLIFTFPHSEQFLPPLPPKSFISRFRPKFLESRRQGLSYFLSYVPEKGLRERC